MLKKFACFFFLFAAVAAAQTTNVTATVTDRDGTLWLNGSVTVQFVPNSAQPNISIYNINGAPLSPSVLNQGPVTLDGTGSFSLSVYDNSKITPVGSQWQFTVCPLAQSKCGITTTPISGVSQNISTLVDANILAPRFNAIAGAYGYANVEAILTYPVGGTYWSVTNQTQMYWNGTTWVAGALPSGISCVGTGSSQVCTFPGAVVAAITNSVVSPCQFAGATADVQISAALASIPMGGTVDARCYGQSTISIASTVQVSTSGTSGPVQTLIFDPATNVLPSTATVIMFNKAQNGTIIGLHTVLPATTAGTVYTGTEILLNTNSTDRQAGRVEDFLQDASAETAFGQTGGIAIYLHATGGNPIAWVNFSHIRCYGGNTCINMTAEAGISNWVNANTFDDVVSDGDAQGVVMTALDTSLASGSGVFGNLFVNFNYEPHAGSGTGWLFTGTGGIQNNSCTNCNFSDTINPIVNQNTGTISCNGSLCPLAGQNYFQQGQLGYPEQIALGLGLATNGTAIIKNFINTTATYSGTTAAENLLGFGWGPPQASNSGAAFGAYLAGFLQAGFKAYCQTGWKTSTLCMTLGPDGTFTVPAGVISKTLTASGQTSTSANGDVTISRASEANSAGDMPWMQLGGPTGSVAYAEFGGKAEIWCNTSGWVLCATFSPAGLVLPGAYANGSGTVIPSTVLGYQGPTAGYITGSISGSATLVSGTATVSTTAACTVGTSCNYSLTRCAANSSSGIGALSVGTITAGTSFVINSLSPVAAVLTTDASTVCWQIN